MIFERLRKNKKFYSTIDFFRHSSLIVFLFLSLISLGQSVVPDDIQALIRLDSTLGEDSWYKAYVVRGSDFGPFDISTPLPDTRMTLYWNANLQTDKDGTATIKFYNSDTTTKLHIEVEGIATGIPISTVQSIGEDE